MMDDERFARIVAQDVKNKLHTSEKEYLALPENRDRWVKCLVLLKENLNGQLADLAEREQIETDRYEALGEDGRLLLAAMLSDVDERRKKILRFQQHVDRRSEAVERLTAGTSQELEERAKLVEFLRRAIEAHRSMMARANFDATLIDCALWDALDGKWEFDQIDIQALIDE
jgi:hypothetical protein